ncbi:hypothetical protein K501DRAFT_195862 [Backusella circina FSU 941]|nr:hypothetical protein K501DRAFT_195862 [Backusella circina FSU 941]
MSFFTSLGNFVRSFSFDFVPGEETNFEDSIGGSWYISPEAHGIEFLTLVPFYLGMTYYYGNKILFKDKTNYKLLTQDMKNRPAKSWLELLCLITMTASYAVTVIHKYITSTEFFLLQPCHASALLLVMVMAWPDKANPFIPQLLFNIYIHTLWGSVLALVFPDLRDHEIIGEIFNFFLEHTLILVLPFYLVFTKRYVVLPFSKNMGLFSYFLYAAYHSPLLHVVSLWSGYNINYTLVPPARKCFSFLFFFF